jgi:hypothetical protein
VAPASDNSARTLVSISAAITAASAAKGKVKVDFSGDETRLPAAAATVFPPPAEV